MIAFNVFDRVLITLEKCPNLQLFYFHLLIFFVHFFKNNQTKVPRGGGDGGDGGGHISISWIGIFIREQISTT